METIEQLYDPYDFSATRCYVVEINVIQKPVTKIEHKLPKYIKELKGIYVSVYIQNSAHKLAGVISLNFNGQSLKCFHSPVFRTIDLIDCSNAVPVDEKIIPNSFMQGYFLSHKVIDGDLPYKLHIYLHYKP